MADDRCEKTELLKEHCGHCNSASGPVWEAKFPAECRTCGKRIEVGTKVKWTDDGLYPQHAHHAD